MLRHACQRGLGDPGDSDTPWISRLSDWDLSLAPWHQRPICLENIGNFIKAITKYGVKPHDIFEANDLFENTNHTQVQSTLLALASMAKTKGNKVNVGVKYAEKQERKFEPEKLREGRNIIGLQMGTNKFASQQGMTAYGTRRHLYDPKLGTDQPLDQATISLQMGTNKGASQAGMTAPGTKRQDLRAGAGHGALRHAQCQPADGQQQGRLAAGHDGVWAATPSLRPQVLSDARVPGAGRARPQPPRT
ncbi:hypothetical protein H8959_004887 [Pygathrix nigripes]